MQKVVKITTQTSVVKTSNSSGFSIVEILVALLLVSIVFLAIPTGDTTHKHRKLQEAIDDIDRSVRFATNESILKNVVVRIKINLEKVPAEFIIEEGPKGELVLPELKDTSSLSLDEIKKQDKVQKSFDSQFTPVDEFKDISRPLPQEVSIEGIATPYQKKILSDQEVSLYFYPSGEKDDALFILGTDQELASLEIEAFRDETKVQYTTLDTSDVANLPSLRQNKIQEIYNEWVKP